MQLDRHHSITPITERLHQTGGMTVNCFQSPPIRVWSLTTARCASLSLFCVSCNAVLRVQGSTHAVMKAVIVASATPSTVVMVRFWLAAVCVVPWLPNCFAANPTAAADPVLLVVRYGLVLGALLSTSFALYAAALQHTSASRVAFVFCNAMARLVQPTSIVSGSAHVATKNTSATTATSDHAEGRVGSMLCRLHHRCWSLRV